MMKNDGNRNETSTPEKPNIKIIFIKKFYGINFLLHDKYGPSDEDERIERTFVQKDQQTCERVRCCCCCQNEVE